MRPEDRERLLVEVTSRIVAERLEAVRAGRGSLEEILADTVYFERKRLKEDKLSPRHKADTAFLNELQADLGRAGERELRTWLDAAVRRYAEEICGNFDRRVYGVATRVLPPALGLLLNSMSPRRLVRGLPELPRLDDNVVIQGELEHVRRLHDLGTLIFAPTHISHMDSILAGYTFFRVGLPPVVYGAGLNLFDNPLVGYFMRHLGAYTVDRKKNDPLYKDVLKAYATASLEYGYDNLFFPGGTRSRSGAVEKRLKLGLLGTGLEAFVNNLQKQRARPRLFVVPITLSYQLVLEAETLIDDFLKEVGKSRYIITDDEFSQPTRVFDFVNQLLSLDSKIYVTFGRALDPFGNPVDDEGRSLDPRGRTVDASAYVRRDGGPVHDPQRDAEHTRELGLQLTAAYGRDNVVQATFVTARAVFTLLRRKNPGVDLLRLLRVGGRHEDVDLREVHAEVDRLMQELRGLSDRRGIRLAPSIASARADDVVAEGLKHFAIFHTRAAVSRRGDRLFATDRNLVFYYQNHLEGYRLDRTTGLPPALTSDHRALSSAAATRGGA